MPLRARLSQDDDTAPSLTPMIDVVLVITIFFMCVTRFSGDERQFEVELPRVSEAAAVSTARPDVLEIMAGGAVELNGEAVAWEALREQLAALRKDQPDVTILVRGDRAVTHGRMAEVYEACRLAGIRHVCISVATKAAPTVVR
jgi:biopolymer transport protein ExbD